MMNSAHVSQNSKQPTRRELEERLAIREMLRARAPYDWARRARPEQLSPPGDWRVWLVLAGRGWGKTRTGAETVRAWVAAGYRRIALVGRTAADVRDVIVEGESGILAVHPDAERPRWNPSNRRLTWPNGAQATTYSADEPDQLRGPQHDAALCDELASWQRPEAWDQLRFGLRLGTDPRVIVTTTPRPTKIIRDLLAASGTIVTRGRTRDNFANLAPGIVEELERRYAGTRLGRQELDGEVLDDTAGALWRWQWIDAARVVKAPDLRRVVVAIDPAVSSNEGSDETGIVVAAVGMDGRGYVLADASGKHRPEDTARIALSLSDTHGADAIVAEVNNGGDWIPAVIRSHRPNANVRTVHASRGKLTRAEPIAALYEQGKVSHCGAFGPLEDQLTTWDATSGRKSPDRLDALVWAFTDLMCPREVPRILNEATYDF
jgi:phage terminase large subunit-like protein